MMSNYYHRITDPYRAMDPAYLSTYNVSGIPIMAYVFIGATTILLAAVTLIEGGSSDEDDDSSIYESLTSRLPAFSNDDSSEDKGPDLTTSIQDTYNNAKDTLTEDAKEVYDKTKEAINNNFQSGGKRKSKKASKKSKKSKSASKKSRKTKRH